MNDKLVSIDMCTYNKETYLKEQIDSILQQIYNNFELIVYYDNPTDLTIGIINNIQKEWNNALQVLGGMFGIIAKKGKTTYFLLAAFIVTPLLKNSNKYRNYFAPTYKNFIILCIFFFFAISIISTISEFEFLGKL